MFFHQHPYPPYIPKNATKLIVGTIPPPRFSGLDLYEDDVDFCYGSKYGLLWPILDEIYNLNLTYKPDQKSISQRKDFLHKFGIGICDMIESCEREKIDAADQGMNNIVLRDLLATIKTYKKIDTILFMGGNSKNGPEYLFRRQLKGAQIKLQVLSDQTPRIHQFSLDNSTVKTISLISPSNAANRSIGGHPVYKERKLSNKMYTTLQFRIDQYKQYFI